MSLFTDGIVEFCAALRGDLGFRVGHAEAHDALLAVGVVGVVDVSRVRSALRLVCCSKPEEVAVFDSAFDAFFLGSGRGVRQTSYAPQHTRPREAADRPAADDRGRSEGRSRDAGELSDPGLAAGKVSPEALVPDALNDAAAAWQSLQARYSPSAGSAPVPVVSADDVARLLGAASALVSTVRLGRLRRWRPQRSGSRFDIRRTMRASLNTGGDAVVLHRLGHPLRNPRFVVLIDGSRSMASHGTLMLRFAYALCRRSSRTSVFLFSTELRDVTRAMRAAVGRREHQLASLGEAWGGGTRIGASLMEFVRGHGSRLTDDTVVVVYSDGLDVGDAGKLERAMREIRRRCAMVLWVNPLVGTPGYAPSARGMAAALPYVSALLGARDAIDYAGFAREARRFSTR